MSYIYSVNWNTLSESMVLAARRGDNTAPYVYALRQANWNSLVDVISTDAEKKAFWINVYNAFIQIEVGLDAAELINNRSRFFKKKRISIGNIKLSFDDIEHVILRRNSLKFGLGYLRFPWLIGRLRKPMLKNHDFRIHFALNCAAASCPPIRAYVPARISEQLHIASKSFLEEDCVLSEKENTVLVSRLMLWFHGDFGGKKGIQKILKYYGILHDVGNIRVSFKPYDWTVKPHNFR